jgi:hypothetical protein
MPLPADTTDRALLMIWARGFAASQAMGPLLAPFEAGSMESHAWRQGWFDATKSRYRSNGAAPEKQYA